MDDAYLTRCVVDPLKRKLYLYSSEGDEKTVDCETVDQFMNMLRFVRDTAGDEVYHTSILFDGSTKINSFHQKGGKKIPPFFLLY